MEFFEAPVFTRLLPRYLEDDEYAGLQQFLATNPEAGDVMPGTGGFGSSSFSMALGGGIDRSRDVVEWAKARFSASVNSGRARFLEGTVEAIPFPAAAFDKVCTVNTIYFWRSLEAGFAEIHRVLAPGGRVVIGFLPKQWMDRLGHPPDIFTSRSSDEVVAGLTGSGFKQVHVERPEPTTRWNVIVATH